MLDMSTDAITQALAEAGGVNAVAAELGMSRWGVKKWTHTGLPPSRVLWLAEKTGWKYTPHMLAADMYPNPTDALPREVA